MVRMACKPGSVPLRPGGRRGDGHSSGTAVARGLVRSTRTTGRRRPRAHALSSLSDLAPGGACRAAPVAGGAVGSYPTVSPLPEPAPAVCSLWRFPWGSGFPPPPPGVTRHRASVEPGLSSRSRPKTGTRSHPAIRSLDLRCWMEWVKPRPRAGRTRGHTGPARGKPFEMPYPGPMR